MPRRNMNFGRLGIVAAASLWTIGCAPVMPVGKPPLALPSLPPGGVVLDVFFVRFPAGDPELTGAVWAEIDELHFAPEVRRRLEANGFRAGVIGGSLPAALERQMQLTDKPATNADGPKAVDLDARAATSRRQLRIRGGKRSTLVVLGERERKDELSVLLRGDDGTVRGRTYKHVLGSFVSRAFPQGDGGVRLELTPELEHGAPQQRYVPGDGMFRFEFGSPREVLDELKLTAQLTPGQILAVTALPDRPGTLGHQFFTEAEAETTVQKMLLVRLLHTDADDRFDAGQPPTTEE